MKCVARTLAVAGLMMAGTAQAETWRQAASSDESIFFVDLDSIRRTGDTIKFMSMSVFGGTTETRDFDKSVIQRNAICSSRSSQIFEARYYAGDTLLEYARTPGKMIEHGPDSVMNGVMQAACGDRAYQSPVVADPVAYGRGKLGVAGSTSSQNAHAQ